MWWTHQTALSFSLSPIILDSSLVDPAPVFSISVLTIILVQTFLGFVPHCLGNYLRVLLTTYVVTEHSETESKQMRITICQHSIENSFKSILKFTCPFLFTGREGLQWCSRVWHCGTSTRLNNNNYNNK